MLNVFIVSVIMLSAVMLNVIMQSVIMLSVFMLSVVMLSVVVLNVAMLSVVASCKCPVISSHFDVPWHLVYRDDTTKFFYCFDAAQGPRVNSVTITVSDVFRRPVAGGNAT